MTREDGPKRAASAADPTKIARFHFSWNSAAEASARAGWVR
jgi:hypothetical protein